MSDFRFVICTVALLILGYAVLRLGGFIKVRIEDRGKERTVELRVQGGLYERQLLPKDRS